jgi:serine/threonine protein kinase
VTIQNELYSGNVTPPSVPQPDRTRPLRRAMEQPVQVNAEPIPGYRLIERLGRGGYGEVWKVEAPGGMHKALKFVFGNMEGAGDSGKAAEQEFKSLNRVKTIRHPFVLSLERFEVVDGQLLIVMELADRNLWDRFNECVEAGMPGIPRPELIRYMEEAAEALDLMNLHHQIQHLDVKPQNIFLVHRHVKVADFGLAKDLEGTRADLTGGITPMYAPPETFEGWVSRQSDQYSLAIVYMEMLTGRRPFTGSTTRQLILQHLTAPPDLSPLSPPDRDAVARALAKKPEERFQTCAEFVRALQSHVPSPPAAAPAVNDDGRSSVAVTTPSRSTCSTPVLARRDSKSLPALITPKSKTHGASSTNTVRKPTSEIPYARPDPVEITGSGVLVPALIVGIGGTGLSILRAMRQLICDRYGQYSLPHLRWLYIDTDPATIAEAVGGPPGAALTTDEVLPAQVRRPTHYLSREGLPPVDAWLPPETLFQIPRTPATEGVRCIGRLALCDHYHDVCNRIRTALEAFLTPTRLEEADRLTRLGIRSSFPRVYVAASLSGGTGSGMFIDLTYLIRREMIRLGFNKPYTVGMLAVPAFAREVPDAKGVANARAALTELQHFAGSGYRAQFDLREVPVADADRPFRRCFLMPLPGKYSRSDRERASARVAHVAYGDLLTTLGRGAYPDEAPAPESPLTTVGIQRVVWPRAQVVRTAGWLLAQKILAKWMVKGENIASSIPGEMIVAQWSSRQLDYASLRASLEEHLTRALGATGVECITQALRTVPDKTDGENPEVVRVRKVFLQLLNLVGSPGLDDREHPHAVGTALAAKVQELASQADSRMQSVILSLVEQPGLRVAGAEEALRILGNKINEELALVERDAVTIEDQAYALFAPLHQQLITLAGESTPRLTFRSGSMTEALTALRQWAMLRLQALLARSCGRVYQLLLGGLPEHTRELNAIRSQLQATYKQLVESAPASSAEDGVYRTVFPQGSRSVAESANRYLDELAPQDVREFENALQGRIRHECRGVVALVSRSRDSGATLISVALDQATRFMESRVPRAGTGQIVSLGAAPSDEAHQRLTELVTGAAPIGLTPASPTLTLLALPEGSGPVCDVIKDLCQGNIVRSITSPDDFVVWRECRGLTLASFPHLTADPPAPASGPAPPADSFHSRTDINWSKAVRT